MVLEQEEESFIRFKWAGSPKDEYFEFKIDKSEITNQTILVITDFAEKKRNKGSKPALGLPGERSVSQTGKLGAHK
ncbi:START-like domain-containing protein [Niabella defluvii]|nr:START-like domain-containing protein [Niabella sp. I65]